ncbi:unnamed protein product [Nesidiocoris tenuis]|uniref:ZP domain-containing protein n=1 Tax=Nesidiocoris tenuis TaxID=355587 RepID=A0A6H5HDE6_9HEMI|nr:unnamed protein product [Nesidiocoris tenuis]
MDRIVSWRGHNCDGSNETSLVSLKIMDMDKKRRLQEVFYSHPYVIRADISRPDGTYGIRVKSCFAFNRRNSSVQLIDDRGCPINKAVLTPFTYNDADGHADSTLFAMFQFSDGNQVHFQCDVGVCKGGCPPLNCDDDIGIRAPTDGGVIVASTSVFVLQPGDPAGESRMNCILLIVFLQIINTRFEIDVLEQSNIQPCRYLKKVMPLVNTKRLCRYLYDCQIGNFEISRQGTRLWSGEWQSSPAPDSIDLGGRSTSAIDALSRPTRLKTLNQVGTIYSGWPSECDPIEEALIVLYDFEPFIAESAPRPLHRKQKLPGSSPAGE